MPGAISAMRVSIIVWSRLLWGDSIQLVARHRYRGRSWRANRGCPRLPAEDCIALGLRILIRACIDEPVLEPACAWAFALCAGRAAAHRQPGEAQYQRKPIRAVAARAGGDACRGCRYAAALSRS